MVQNDDIKYRPPALFSKLKKWFLNIDDFPLENTILICIFKVNLKIGGLGLM